MPKSNLCKPRVDPREAGVRELIGGKLLGLDMPRKKLASKVNIPISTLNARIKDPRTMRLGELWDILDILNPDEAEKMKIV